MKLLSMVVGLFSASPAMAIAPGQPAPDFTAKNQDGKEISLSSLKGKPVILFFYPKDDTPGCTKEVCNFRDEFSKFKKAGAVVLGISRQDEKSHQAFRAKHKLPFDLLVDQDGKLAESFGVATMQVVGFHKRQSILIGADGKVAMFYPDVDPVHHTAEVLKDLENLKK